MAANVLLKRTRPPRRALSYLVNKNDLMRRSSYIRAGCRAGIGHYSMIAVSSAGPPLALSRKGRIKRSDTCAEDTISCQVITELDIAPLRLIPYCNTHYSHVSRFYVTRTCNKCCFFQSNMKEGRHST